MNIDKLIQAGTKMATMLAAIQVAVRLQKEPDYDSLDEARMGWIDACNETVMKQPPNGWRMVPDDLRADEIVSRMFLRFRDWSRKGFGPEDVTWCEVRADVLALIHGTIEPTPPAPDARASNAEATLSAILLEINALKNPWKTSDQMWAAIGAWDRCFSQVQAAIRHACQENRRPMSWAAADVLIERQRQQSVEGWSTDHDDQHNNEEIAAFAALYAAPASDRNADAGYGLTIGDRLCPEGWHPKFGDRRRELVKAGALILAEIERLDRASTNG